jgi:N-acetylmuramic acid 6-phosphate (MurNAc-6-P) etherase
MTNLVPASRKLERRALRILMTLGGVDEPAARALLAECRGSVSGALEALRRAREGE